MLFWDYNQGKPFRHGMKKVGQPFKYNDSGAGSLGSSAEFRILAADVFHVWNGLIQYIHDSPLTSDTNNCSGPYGKFGFRNAAGLSAILDFNYVKDDLSATMLRNTYQGDQRFTGVRGPGKFWALPRK